MPGHPTPFTARACLGAAHALLATVVLLAALRAAPLPAPDYHVRTWTTDDGLPHNSASELVQDRAGFLWFATVGGLARFDGREFREVRIPLEHRTRGYNVRALAEESPGTLVILPTSGTVLRHTQGGWSVHPVSATLAQHREQAAELHMDPRGGLWVGTTSGRIVRWLPDGRAKIFAGNADVPTRFHRLTFASDAAGNTWVGSDSLLAVEDGGELRPLPEAPREPLLVARGRGGRIWVCTDTRLLRLEGGKLNLETEAVPWRGAFVGIRHMFEDSRGALWIASSRMGLVRYGDGRFATVATPYPSASFVAEDREGNVWAGTDGRGVMQLREKPYRLYNLAAGLAHEVVSSLAPDAAGRVWLANRTGGIAAVEPDGTLRTGSIASGPRIYANVVGVDAEDHVWFGGGHSGLFRWDPKGSAAPVQMPAPASNLHVLFLARNGDLWFATARGGGVGFYRDGRPRMLPGIEGDVGCLAEDRAGHIWLAQNDGRLLRWDGAALERFEVGPEKLPQPVHAIYTDAAGRLWIGTAGGLAVKEGATFHLLTSAHGLADDIILQIAEDEAERLWLGTRRGLFYAAKSQLLGAACGRSERIVSHMFGRNQGLSGLSPTANYNPAAAKNRDGKLWFATTQGALAIDPARMPHDLPAPPVLIEDMRVDGQAMPTGGPVRVGSGPHRIDFRFAALSFTAPEDVMLRHRLEGADQQWVETGRDRSASYTHLPPGDYRLRVIARNSAGEWNLQGATLAFTVVPAWWETFAARAVALGLFAGLSAWIARTFVQRRLRRKLERLEQEHALEKERARIARDLHDELGASLTEVGLLADRLVGCAPPDLAPQLSGLAWQTRRTATELSSIVWTMSGKNSSLDRFAEFLRRYAERLLRNTATRCLVTGVESIPAVSLAPALQHQMLAAAKEALNNVLKHARATEAVIQVQYAHGIFELRIGDNGTGFAPATASAMDGNGLRNMRTRLEEIGGAFELASVPGAGTHVILRLPCTGDSLAAKLAPR